ncbi:MAG: 50S ribosomal protein L11 methyltransferase [Salinivirgaceae bacterium]|nr:50S ribosomal protein L11 methyltransferase [Salinivirgaceae bacterium]
MQYIETQLTFAPATPDNREILAALLAEIGYDSFMDTPTGLSAYIPADAFSTAATEAAIEPVRPLFEQLTVESSPMPDVDWNAEWEKSFTPITIDGRCRIRAPFHDYDAAYQLDIVIEPKMAFGTGHHATTTLMIRQLFDIDLTGKKVLDMGCGTGVLAIAALKLGAGSAVAIDIDHWSVENTLENAARNNVALTAVEGGVEAISGTFDIILANINRNILLDQMPVYSRSLAVGGVLCLSGFYATDLDIIREKASQLALQFEKVLERDEWVSARFVKTK